MRVPFIAALLGLVAANSLSAVQESKPEQAVLPTQARTLLAANFPRWRPKQLSDMDADDQQLWLNGPNGSQTPGISVGHFEAAGELSYAVLLVPKSDPSGGYKIVVFSKEPEKGTFMWKLLDHADGQAYSGLVISKAGPGKFSDLVDRKSVYLKLDGIYVEWMEKGAVLYYWSESRYQKLAVSD
jgi:hypothetical protein